MSLLQLEQLVAGYDNGPDILNGVSLKLNAGTVQCVIGPNGAGKSTVLKAIAGLVKVRSGTITYKERSIHMLPPHQRLALGICFVPQERALFPDMTVEENLRMGGYILNERGTIKERVEQVFQQFPQLYEKRSHAAKQLSGGQQQMLTMGRALVLRPEVVMLDEPSLGLAPRLVDQVFEMIDQFRQQGMSILLVEQNAVKGLQQADWGVVLDLGENSFEGPAAQILNDPRIRDLYLGKAAR